MVIVTYSHVYTEEVVADMHDRSAGKCHEIMAVEDRLRQSELDLQQALALAPAPGDVKGDVKGGKDHGKDKGKDKGKGKVNHWSEFHGWMERCAALIMTAKDGGDVEAYIQDFMDSKALRDCVGR